MIRFSKYRIHLAVVCFTAGLILTVDQTGAAKAGNENESREGRGPDAYTIGLFGDMPYNALGRAQYPALLADINANHVAFSVFDGDLKAGGDGPCSDSLYTTDIDNLDKSEPRIVLVPGATITTVFW